MFFVSNSDEMGDGVTQFVPADTQTQLVWTESQVQNELLHNTAGNESVLLEGVAASQIVTQNASLDGTKDYTGDDVKTVSLTFLCLTV